MGLTPESKKIFHHLTARQWDYLVFLKQHNICLYGEVREMFMADIINNDDPSGTSTPSHVLSNGWNEGVSPSRSRKDLEMKQRAGYAL